MEDANFEQLHPDEPQFPVLWLFRCYISQINNEIHRKQNITQIHNYCLRNLKLKHGYLHRLQAKNKSALIWMLDSISSSYMLLAFLQNVQA